MTDVTLLKDTRHRENYKASLRLEIAVFKTKEASYALKQKEL
jgi:hypothetical protein